ncbi:MAG: hypothetical protein ACLR2G_12330 [Phascolarctobacterium faecium]
MLIFGPAVSAVACCHLTMGPQSTTLGALICALFAVYWAIEPGGVVGYAGAIYGRVGLGKLWGLPPDYGYRTGAGQHGRISCRYYW